MKIDVYTKVILTGIFLCLCLILLRDVRFEKTAEAQVHGAAQPVVITGCTNGVGRAGWHGAGINYGVL